MKKVLFIDRDGVLVVEPEPDQQVDSFHKLEFYPKVISYLSRIANELDFELVMVTNQDGLGTSSFPEETFWGPHHLLLRTLASEGIHFKEICIDRSLESEKSENRKPGVGMLKTYIDNKDYDLKGSWVIGDRWSDMQLANEQTSWTPKALQEGRFKNIIESAPDWNISRDRYWANGAHRRKIHLPHPTG